LGEKRRVIGEKIIKKHFVNTRKAPRPSARVRKKKSQTVGRI